MGRPPVRRWGQDHPLLPPHRQVAGYALLNLFALAAGDSSLAQPGLLPRPGGGGADVEPIDPLLTPIVLNAGAFQLPLFQRPPPKGDGQPPLTVLSLDGPRVPCATLLVRVLPIERGAAPAFAQPPPPAPHYDSGAYDSSRCRPLPAEALLYPKRANAQARAVGHVSSISPPIAHPNCRRPRPWVCSTSSLASVLRQAWACRMGA